MVQLQTGPAARGVTAACFGQTLPTDAPGTPQAPLRCRTPHKMASDCPRDLALAPQPQA